MVIRAFVEMECELSDYFDPVSIGVWARNGRRELKREMNLTQKDLLLSIRADEVECNRRYEDNNMRFLRLVGASVKDISTFLSEIAYNL